MDPLEELRQAFDSYFAATGIVIDKLEDIVEMINQHHGKINLAKTAGTTVSVLGGAIMVGGILLAPFTGGTSVVAATGLGGVSGLVGCTVSLGTDIYDTFKSKSFQDDMKSCIDEREKSVERLRKLLINFAKIADEIQNYDSAKDPYGIRLVELAYTVGLKIENVKDTWTIISSSKHAYNFSLRAGGNVWKSMRLASVKLTSNLSRIGINISKKAAMNIVKGANVAAAVVFAVGDITSLVNSITSKHPVNTSAVGLINELKDEIEQMKKTHDEFFGTQS